MIFKSIIIAIFSILLSFINKVDSRGRLIFEDQFTGDLSKWQRFDGGGGFGNFELQYYRAQNARTENGNLIIESKRESFSGSSFTSAKLTSKQSFKYGYFEIRAKLPSGRGTWPAFWLLPKNPAIWPNDGEISAMEHVGWDSGNIYGSIHCQRYNHIKGTAITKTLKIADPFNTFHVYGVEWSPNSIKLFVDGNQYFQYDKEDNSYDSWPFDNEFNIILNTAVGGGFGGKNGVDASVFPTRFTIDYVRVYAPDNNPVSNPIVNRITLKCKQNSKYVSADNYGKSALVANRDTVDTWETFEFIKNADGTVSFKAIINSGIVSADKNGNSPLIANRAAIGDWEKFTLISNLNDGTVSFRTKINNNYVSAFNNGGIVIANKRAASDWERFYVTNV